MTAGSTAALEARSISKHFAGTQALADASLSVPRGTVHALLGGNGSGKSTLIKCLAGVHTADAGEVRVNARVWAAADITPDRAARAGLRFVHQDLGLFESLTVAENFALDAGFPTNGVGGIRWSALRNRVAAVLEQYDVPAAPDTPVGALRPAVKTMVAIARALQDQQDSEHILLLDEPTASLPEAESRSLMQALRARAAGGQSIVLVSHRLPEVLDVADGFTVFRDGRVADSIIDRVPTEDELIGLIAGKSVTRPVAQPRRLAGEAAVLEMTEVHAAALAGLSLSVNKGEIVGLAGLLGAGRSTALSVAFGLHPPTSGTVRLAGEDVTRRPVHDRIRRGIALVPQDRLRDSVLARMSVRDNVSISVLRRYFKGFMQTRREHAEAEQLIATYTVRAESPNSVMSTLSGGNQQKVVLARWLRRDPSLLLLDEPTQGVDVVARQDIHGSVRDIAAAGCAVLVASSDFAELAQLCDRVIVLRGGRAHTTIPARDLSLDLITELVQKDSIPA